MKTTIEPEYIPSEGDIADLSSVVVMPGFRVIQKLIRSECDKLIISMFNSEPGNTEEILEKYHIAKSAVVVYDKLANHINELIDIHRSIRSQGDRPIDPTEGLIDFGDTDEVV